MGKINYKYRDTSELYQALASLCFKGSRVIKGFSEEELANLCYPSNGNRKCIERRRDAVKEVLLELERREYESSTYSALRYVLDKPGFYRPQWYIIEEFVRQLQAEGMLGDLADVGAVQELFAEKEREKIREKERKAERRFFNKALKETYGKDAKLYMQ